MKAALIRGAIATTAAAALGFGATPALAAPAAPAAPTTPALAAGCTQSGLTVTCKYTAQGESQFAVPDGVHSVTATVGGGQGGADFGRSTPGGLGAVATGTVSVTPGQVIFAEVGILGGAAGSLFPGFADSGAGGGESDVRTCPSGGSQPCAAGSTLASRLLVAGGGGGSGDFGGAPGNAGTGGNGGDGTAGTDGAHNAGGGGGATLTAPGAGGAACDGGGDGSPGAAAGGAGGDAGSANGIDGVSGGGGGAGWFGGGAGGGCSHANDDGGPGGGGSSHAGSSVSGVSFSQAAAGQAPSVTIAYIAPFTVTTASLPGGTVGVGYTATLDAAGGTTPFTWSLGSGSTLPVGLALSSDGTISGTPQAGGGFSFTVQVTDSSSPAQTASKELDLDISKAAPGLSLSVSPPAGTATVLDPVTLTAKFAAPGTAPSPSGNVDFTVDGTAPSGCGSVQIAGGQATCTVSSLPGGQHDLAVSYPGDSNYLSDSASITGYTVSKVTPTVTVTPSVAAPVWGQGVSFTATVTAAGQPAVGGTVQWSVNGTPAGAPVPVASDGTASLGPLTDLPVGSDQVTADYSGSDQDAPGTVTETITVGKAATKTTLSVTRQQMTATVTPVAPGAGQPTGTVTFAVDGIRIGTAKLSAQGVAILSLKSSGTGIVSASYGGDDHFTASSISTVVRNLVR
jgi:hypothetical protein